MAYSYHVSITTDNTKVSGTSNLTDFPVLVSGTYDGTGGEPDLRTVANGGKIQNTASGGNSGSITVPADLAFYNDADLTTQYDHEIEFYNATTGEIVAWVRIPTLSYNSDTTFYMHYGDSGVTTSQENISGVWPNYLSVWHFNENFIDSSGNNKTLTNSGTSDRIGLIGKGRNMTSTTYIYRADDTNYIFTGNTEPWEMSIWVNFDTLGGSGRTRVAGMHSSVNNADASNNIMINWTSGLSEGYIYDGTGKFATYSVSWATSTWYYLVAKFDGSNLTIVHNGNASTPIGTSGNTASTVDTYQISNSSGAQIRIDGIVDESRIYYASPHTTDWTITEYNNQNSPSTFYTMGNEQSGEPGIISPFPSFLH
jgi:hypothetical protein